MDKTVKVWIGNYGAYAAGHLIDRPAELPMSPQELDGLLADMRRQAEELVGSPCEEFYISDYDGYPLDGGWKSWGDLFNEHTPIESLNLMAVQIATMDEQEVEACAAYIGNQGSMVSMDEALNVLLQADDVGYFSYGWPEYTGSDHVYQALHDSTTPEEKFGWMQVEHNPALKKLLDEDGKVSSAFDVEEYGRQVEMASDVKLFEDGYLDGQAADVDMGYYSHDEIVSEVAARALSDPELSAIGEGLERELEKKAEQQVMKDLWGAKGYYNPGQNMVIASVKAEHGGEQQYRICAYEGVFASPERVLSLAESGIDVADYCRDNHLLEAMEGSRLEALLPDMAKDGRGWYYSEPDVVKKVLPGKLAREEGGPQRFPMPQAKAPQRKAPQVSGDSEAASRSATAQARSAQQQVRDAAKGARS